MLNIKILEHVEECYLRDLPVRFKKEKFKWQAIQHFQKHWDIEAPDFAAMLDLSLSKTYDLLTSGHYFARTMVINFAKEDPDGVRELFRMLYDETRDLTERVERFVAYADDKIWTDNESRWNNHYQDIKSVSVYLWLRYPDKYYIYKYNENRSAAEILGSSFVPKKTASVENMIGSFRMCDEIRDHLIQNEAIINAFKGLLTPDCYPDPEYRTLAFDVVFYTSRYYQREELNQALEQMDMSSYGLIEKKGEGGTRVWKISEGGNATGVPEHIKRVLEARKVATVHGHTRAKGSTAVSQGEQFMTYIHEGDYFYLCYASNVRLLGQFASEEAVPSPEMNEIEDGWYERPYRLIAEAINEAPYTGKKKWWTPNDNSTCIQIPPEELPLFEELILKPYFDRRLADLSNEMPDQQRIDLRTTEIYTREVFLSEVFMSGESLDRLMGLLRRKKNVILQGAPGVGKTFTARRLAWLMMGEKDLDRIASVQFHQSYSYEDFIMGYKPDGAQFALKTGIFYDFCERARQNPSQDYFFIIDEINRGNLSKIFGELLQLIEADYRGEETLLAYSQESFSVPKNLYLIGMMNTADRSLAMIDYALRRRFSFFEMAPGFTSEGFKTYAESIQDETFDELVGQLIRLNKEISDDPTLGKGFRIGHSYLCTRDERSDISEWLRSVVEYDILPTLQEYWFDDAERLERWEHELRSVFNE